MSIRDDKEENTIITADCKNVINNLNKDDINNIKKRKIWDSWTREEKILFYEAIANGSAGALSLQNLFKTMNEKIGTKSTEKIRDYYYRAHKQVSLLLKSAGNTQVNLKDKKEALCALKCYGKLIMSDKNKNSSKIDTMKNLNKHPRLLKQVASHLKKMVTSKIKSLRKYKDKRQIFVIENKIKDKNEERQSEKNENDSNLKIKNIVNKEISINQDSNFHMNKNYERTLTEIKNVDLEKRSIKFERFVVRLLPYNTETYCKTIMSKLNPRLELIVSYSRSMISIVEFLSEKQLKNIKDKSNKYVIIYPIQDLWKNSTDTSKVDSNLNNNISDNLQFSLTSNTKFYDVGDVWLGYGKPCTNLIYLYYEIKEKDTNNQILTENSLLVNPTLKDNTNKCMTIKSSSNSKLNPSNAFKNQNYDEEFEFDPLDFLGLYDDEKKEITSELSGEDIDYEDYIECNDITNKTNNNITDFSQVFKKGVLNKDLSFDKKQLATTSFNNCKKICKNDNFEILPNEKNNRGFSKNFNNSNLSTGTQNNAQKRIPFEKMKVDTPKNIQPQEPQKVKSSFVNNYDQNAAYYQLPYSVYPINNKMMHCYQTYTPIGITPTIPLQPIAYNITNHPLPNEQDKKKKKQKIKSPEKEKEQRLTRNKRKEPDSAKKFYKSEISPLGKIEYMKEDTPSKENYGFDHEYLMANNHNWYDDNSMFRNTRAFQTNLFNNDYRTKDFTNSINFTTSINNYNLCSNSLKGEEINFNKEFKKK